MSPLIDPTADAVLSDSLADLMVPGVLVELGRQRGREPWRIRGNRAHRG